MDISFIPRNGPSGDPNIDYLFAEGFGNAVNPCKPLTDQFNDSFDVLWEEQDLMPN